MTRRLIAAAALAAILAVPASAQGPGGYGPGFGMGPGMMGGFGPGYGMGPGMMGGYGSGYGMGPGMMGGYGPGYGMGPEMMWGHGRGGYGAANLSDEQRAKIAEIQKETQQKRWDLMNAMHEQQYRLQEFYAQGKEDAAAARKAYQAMADTHKEIFEISAEARKRIDAVLTKEQREQMRRGWKGR